jgi:hypothetical protein
MALSVTSSLKTFVKACPMGRLYTLMMLTLHTRIKLYAFLNHVGLLLQLIVRIIVSASSSTLMGAYMICRGRSFVFATGALLAQNKLLGYYGAKKNTVTANRGVWCYDLNSHIFVVVMTIIAPDWKNYNIQMVTYV